MCARIAEFVHEVQQDLYCTRAGYASKPLGAAGVYAFLLWIIREERASAMAEAWNIASIFSKKGDMPLRIGFRFPRNEGGAAGQVHPGRQLRA